MQQLPAPAGPLELSETQGGRTSGPPAYVVVPALLAAGLLLLPIVYLVLRASGASEEAWALFARPRTWEIALRSLILMLGVTGFSLLIAVPIAWLTARTDLPLRKGIAVAAMLPLVVPSYIGAFLIVSALGPRGVLYELLNSWFGLASIPDIYGLPGALLVLTLLSYPYILLPVYAALRQADPVMEEAAASLGSGIGRTFRTVTLPLMRPALVGGSFLVALYALSDFGAVSILRYETFTWAIYLQYRAALDRHGAALLAVALVILALAVVSLLARTARPVAKRRSGVGVLRAPRPIPLGRWKWPAFGFCASVLTFALGLPVAMLGYWLARGVAAGEQLDAVWGWTANSVGISSVAALLTTAIAVPIALLVTRYPGIIGRWVERAAYVGFALPGIVIALSLVFFGAQYAFFIYQTFALLIAAYVIHFMAGSLASLRATFGSVDRSMEEAARGLGQSPLGALFRVTIPIVWPGLLAGTAIVFLLVMKELPATLLVAPLGFKTLATAVWSFSESAFFARGALPALVLLLVSAIPMAILTIRGSRWT